MLARAMTFAVAFTAVHALLLNESTLPITKHPDYPLASSTSTSRLCCPNASDSRIDLRQPEGNRTKPPSWLAYGLACIIIGIIVLGVVTWRLVRRCGCYVKLKYQLRHEKNRAVARCCVSVMPCCAGICHEYTKESFSEIAASASTDGSGKSQVQGSMP